MTRPARIALSALLAAFVACFGFSPLAAQDEKKPGKKPTPGKKKDAEKDEMKEKDEPKSDGDKEGDKGKAREPSDEKQKKQFEKIKLSVEKKFRKSSKEVVYVYTTTEKTAERVEPTSEAPPTEQPGKGGRGGKGKPTGQGGAGHWEVEIKNTAYMTKDRDEAIEKVYAFLVEFPPPAPGSRKKKAGESDEPPPPERSWEFIKTFPASPEGEKQAEAEHERLEKIFMKQKQQADQKKMARKKAG
jgi:hypothetical protein